MAICDLFLFGMVCGSDLPRGHLGRGYEPWIFEWTVCPVYGFGVVSVFALINLTQPEGTQMSDLLVYVFGVILATLIELVAGWLLDICFHARWWDYSKQPLIFVDIYVWSFH